MRIKQNKKRLIIFIAVFSVLSIAYVALCLIGIGGSHMVAHAHSGGTDSSGGHKTHTQACRDRNYKNCVCGDYHYHFDSMSGIGGTTPNIGNNGNNIYQPPKLSDEEMQALAKKQLDNYIAKNGYPQVNQPNRNDGNSTSKSTENSYAWIGIVAIGGIISIGFIGYGVFKKNKT